jgi:hypothetical protein
MPDKKGQAGGIGIVILIAIIIIALILLFQNQNQTYVPGVDFKINPESVQIKDGSYSRIVTITVTKTDNEYKQTEFTIKLNSDTSNVYVVSVNNNQTVTEYNTKPLIDPQASDPFQFKVFGTLPAGYSTATTHVNAQLLYNNTPIAGKEVTLTIDITK